jgi:hypothetical protein
MFPPGGDGVEIPTMKLVGARYSIVGGVVLHNRTTSIIVYFKFFYFVHLKQNQKQTIPHSIKNSQGQLE